ncbi:MAG: DUF2029 domain-containing protein [Bacteroidetes bacterium]|nr:DUF2029 domain-containing protein [Bacteroidota bacterium]
MDIRKNLPVIFLFCICVFCLVLARNKPVGDFGNYYYGSKIFSKTGSALSLYSDIHQFNEQIKIFGEKNFFENYIPVPPFSIILYYPFIFFKCSTAKLVFNILGALLICFSTRRFLRLESKSGYPYAFAIFALLLPLFNNMVQGQSYTIIAALLLEIYIARQKGRHVLIGCLIALIFHIKLFPAFILFYFIVKKEFKVVLWSLLMIVLLLVITVSVVGGGVVTHYFEEIVPRLFKNEIVDPFYAGHQSLHVFLTNVFCYDGLSNPYPLVNMPAVAAVIEGVVVGLLLYLSAAIIKWRDECVTYGMFSFLIIVINKYIPSYSLLILFPFILSVFNLRKSFLILVLLTLACNLPMSWFAGSNSVVMFSRAIILLSVYSIVVFEFKPVVNYLKLTAVIFIVVLSMLLTVDEREEFYVKDTNRKGVYYSLDIEGNQLLLKRCMGSTDYIEELPFPGVIRSVQSIASHPLLNSKKENVKNIFLINQNTLVYLSDINQGVGMLKPRIRQLR